MLGIVSIFCLMAILHEPTGGMFPRPGGPHRVEGRQKRMLGGDEITSYDLPYTCSLHYTEDYIPIGTCSIITSRIVLTSMETMDVEGLESIDETVTNRKIEPGFNPVLGPHFQKAKLSIRNVKDMIVGAGKDYLKPNDEIKLLKDYQEQRTYASYVIVTSTESEGDWVSPSQEERYPWAKDIHNNTYQDFEFFTYRFNFVFLELQNTFKWSTHVLPIPMDRVYSNDYTKLRDEMKRYQDFMNNQDINEYASVTAPGQFCVVGGWALREDRPLTFKEVMMVTRNYCQTCYCNYQPVCCLEFPATEDICFTATAYGDVCDFDQGAALFCAHFDLSVIGFVKKSISCGLKNIPVVYTPAWIILKAYFDMFPEGSWDPRPDWNNYKLYASSTVPTL